MSKKKEDWEIKRDKDNAKRMKAYNSLSADQQKAVDKAFEIVSSVNWSLREMFDITIQDARALDDLQFSLDREFCCSERLNKD
tara:strand:- start:230 stop:478 length:249 start_codon:yes stop_codon:yes gene_type:complete